MTGELEPVSPLHGLVAVYGGPSTSVIHLHLPSFRTQKPRSTRETALCGPNVNHTTPPPVGPRPTGRIWIPLEKAVAREREFQEKLAAVVSDDDPWLLIRDRRFCGKCLGIAAVHAGLGDWLAGILAATIEEAS